MPQGIQGSRGPGSPGGSWDPRVMEIREILGGPRAARSPGGRGVKFFLPKMII